MSSFRLAMVDVDGTLRDGEGWLPGALDLLQALSDADLNVALCSGRPAHSLQETAANLPMVTHVAGAGGSVVQRRDGDAWVTLLERTLPASALDAVVGAARDHDLELWAYTPNDWLVIAETPMVEREVEILQGVRPTVVESFDGRTDVLKMMGVNATTDQQRALAGATQGLGLVVVKSNPEYDDVISADSLATKGGEALVEALGIDWPQVVAIGDGPNDVGMVGRAGLGICLPKLTNAAVMSANPLSAHRTLEAKDRFAAIEQLREFL